MLQKHQRPLTKRERGHLQRLLEPRPTVTMSSTLRWGMLWTGTMTICLVLFGMGVSRAGGIWTIVIPIVFIVGVLSFYFAYMVFSGYVRLTGYARRFARVEAPKVRADLEDGRVSVWSVTSDSATIIEEFEDEGSAYIFDLGDGTSLYLRGQEYYPSEEGGVWPARQFELVRGARSGRLIGIFAGNEPPANVRSIPMAEMGENFWSANRPETETVHPGSPDELVKSLGHRAGSKSKPTES